MKHISVFGYALRKAKGRERKMKIIGLTGTVGCGKSTVGKLMQDNFSVKLVMTDKLGHFAMKRGNSAYEKVVNLFGSEILTETGEIDRKILGNIVFENKEKLDKLNGVIHPWVKQYLQEDIAKETQLGRYQFYVIESAILFETGLNDMCEENWCIDTCNEIRKERLKVSRGYSDEKIASILSNQGEKNYFMEHCDFIIENNRSLDDVLRQIEKLLV